MGRPLLTDEIIERANRGEIFYDDNYLEDDEETKVIRTDRYDTLSTYESYDYDNREESEGVLDRWRDRKKTISMFIKVVALKMRNAANFSES